MEKRSIVEGSSNVIGNEIVVENGEPAATSFVTLVLTKDVKLKMIGPVTGIEYIFNGAGSENHVDERDAIIMLTKRNNRPCCSGSMATPYFEKVG